MHTSAHNETEAIKQRVALNMLEAVAQWLCSRNQPNLAARMLENFTEEAAIDDARP